MRIMMTVQDKLHFKLLQGSHLRKGLIAAAVVHEPPKKGAGKGMLGAITMDE